MTTVYYLLYKRFEEQEGGLEALKEKSRLKEEKEKQERIQSEARVGQSKREQRVQEAAQEVANKTVIQKKTPGFDLTNISKLVGKKKAQAKRKQEKEQH